MIRPAGHPTIVRAPDGLAERAQRSVIGPPIRSAVSRWTAVGWRRNGSPEPAPPHIKRQVVRDHVKVFGPAYFVETGTYRGDTIAEIRDHVRRCVSIELDETLCALARHRFRRHPDVEILWGDSGELLPGVLAELDEPAVLWLDGHYSGGVTADLDDGAPILRELTAALTSAVPHLVLIDDARLFDGTDGYPTRDRVFEIIESHRPNGVAEVSHDIIASRP